MWIYIYIYRFAELDYLVEDIYCYSEFHAPCGAIIRQLPKITDTYEDVQNLKIQNNAKKLPKPRKSSSAFRLTSVWSRNLMLQTPQITFLPKISTLNL